MRPIVGKTAGLIPVDFGPGAPVTGVSQSYAGARSRRAGRSCRADLPGHDPCVLADLAGPGEPVLLEELDRRAEQEPARGLAAGGHLRDRLDQAAPVRGDLLKCAFQRRPGDSLAAMVLVDPDARDPPVRPRRRVLVVFALVLDGGQFLRASVLAPPLRGAALVEDQRRVRAVRPDPALLPGTVLRRVCMGQLAMEAHAPATSEDPVVALHHLCEGIPRGRAERPDRVRHHRFPSSRRRQLDDRGPGTPAPLVRLPGKTKDQRTGFATPRALRQRPPGSAVRLPRPARARYGAASASSTGGLRWRSRRP